MSICMTVRAQMRNNTGRKTNLSFVGSDVSRVNDQHMPRQIVRKTRTRRTPRYLKIFFSALGLYLLFTFLTGGYQIWQLKKQINVLEQEQGTLLEKQQVLVNEMQSLNDPESIEKIARESLGMVKAGETIVVPAVPEKNIPKPREVNQADMGD